MKDNINRSTVVLYTCGICNLNCRYCQIDKNPVLYEIDKVLAESFKGDYYYNRIRQYFPLREQLKRVETWGGEPFMYMDRIYPLVHKLIEFYPYFSSMYSSTNFSYDTWFDQFIGLMNCFGDYPDREFTYELQLSVDGPEEINDRNRGKGVTKACIANFDKLVQYIKDGKFPKNVKLSVALKGTWDLEAIRDLNDEQSLIRFFQFYENTYLDKINSLNNPQFIANTTVPNMAVPSPSTKEDGLIFAELVKKCRLIESKNKSMHYFKYYEQITPFSCSDGLCNTTYRQCHCGCGTGSSMVGFLPDNMISICHEGFTQFIEKYKEYANQATDRDDKVICFDQFMDDQAGSLCLSDEQYETYEYKISLFMRNGAAARLASDTATIMALAMADQIDKRYLDESTALYAASLCQHAEAFCIKNNYNITGSLQVQPDGMFKLLLNGAMDYLFYDAWRI